jgi:hypothetical protein
MPKQEIRLVDKTAYKNRIVEILGLVLWGSGWMLSESTGRG